MNRRCHIRHAVLADARALGAIQAASHRRTYQGVMPDTVLARQDAARLGERFAQRLQAAAGLPGEQRLWVAEVDGEPVGYAATQPGASTFLPPPPGAGELESLYLRPDTIGQGLGWALHQHALGDLQSRGFGPVILWAFAANHPARRFYERAGWALDVAEAQWLLDGVACPIVRYRWDPTPPSCPLTEAPPSRTESHPDPKEP